MMSAGTSGNITKTAGNLTGKKNLSTLDTSSEALFEPKAVEKAKNKPKSFCWLVYMSPADFLRLARNGYQPYKEKRVKEAVLSRSLLTQIPYLGVSTVRKTSPKKFNWKVVSHEGRHRARVLLQLGYTSIPVIIRHTDTDWYFENARPKYVEAQESRKYALLYTEIVLKEYSELT